MANVYRQSKESCQSVARSLRSRSKWRRWLGAIIPLSLAWTIVAEEPVPLGPSFDISEDRERVKDRPRMTALDGGRFVVVWEEDTPSAVEDEVGLQGRLFDSTGSPEGPAFQVNAYTTGSQQEPAVAAWPDGRFVVAYSSGPYRLFDIGSETREVRARVFDRTGQAVGSDFQVSEMVTSGLSKQRRPAVAAFDNGDFIVTWERFEERTVLDLNHIVGRRVAADGALSDPFLVTDEVEGQERSAVAALDGGGFVVTWETTLFIETGSREEVFGRTYDADGDPVGDFTVDEHISSNLWRVRPHVAATAPGEFVVAWRSFFAYQYYYPVERINTRRFDASGLALGPLVELAAEEGAFDLHPRVAGRNDGSFTVVWAPSRTSFGPFSTSLRAMGPDGMPRSGILRLGPEDVRQSAADLTYLQDHQLAVTWNTFREGTLEGVIEGRRVGLPCTPADDVLCLNDDRFRVTVQWRDAQDRTGVGRLVDNGTTNDSGLFWFFAPNNWELLVKLIDGCAFNDRFWVFAAAVTDVEYTLRVVDTQTGAERVYANPLGQASDAVTDTEALAGCP